MKCFLTVFKKPLQSKVLLVMKLTVLMMLFFTLNVSANANVSCDGRICQADDLKPGMRIRITTMTDANQLVTRIEALDKQEAFDILN
jgi:hypothetical protein